ncbi:thiamine phosphate synthase [Pseudoruminococcus massiliensis]|uniref:thiamine phosphate synthase n=1 Tax=Pseudoruminococcus massiliensis TaxID=2086583 RepID=UPI00402866AC
MLFVITSSKSCKEDFLTRIERIASANPNRIILREKHLSQDDLLKLAIKCKEICDKYSVAFSVNGSIEVARKVNADIHLPYKLFVENNENIKDFSTIGVSVHSISEAETAEMLGASYLIAGHIFATDCKKGLKPRGIEYLSDISEAVKIPVLGIGGISLERLSSVLQTGAAGACVMSHFMNCDNPESEVSVFKKFAND